MHIPATLLLGLALATSACGGRGAADRPLRLRPAGRTPDGSYIIQERRWKDVWLLGEFTREDVEAIAALVAIESRGAPTKERRLLSISYRDDGVHAETGCRCGAMGGYGLGFVLEKIGGRWVVISRYDWEA